MTFSWNDLSAQAHPSGTMFEQCLAPIWVYDTDENPLYSSPRGLQLLQIPVSAQSRAVLDINDFVCSSDRHLDVELKQRLLNHELATYTVEKRLVTHKGELLWVNFNVSRLEFAESHSLPETYVMIGLEDITEQRKLYDALIRTEEKWKTFVLNSAHLFLQTSNVGRILYVSPAVERILGYQETELLDCSIAELIHPQDCEEFKVTFQQWVSGSSLPQPHLECRWQTRSGQWMYLYLQGQRFPLALNIEGVAISGYNISDRKHLEIALAASERKLKSLTTNTSWPVMQSLPSPFRGN